MDSPTSYYGDITSQIAWHVQGNVKPDFFIRTVHVRSMYENECFLFLFSCANKANLLKKLFTVKHYYSFTKDWKYMKYGWYFPATYASLVYSHYLSPDFSQTVPEAGNSMKSPTESSVWLPSGYINLSVHAQQKKFSAIPTEKLHLKHECQFGRLVNFHDKWVNSTISG